jgi:hypothetical protein
MNKKKEIDKLVRLTILNNFISSKLKEQKDLVKSFVGEDDKVLKGIEHKMNVIRAIILQVQQCRVQTQ